MVLKVMTPAEKERKSDEAVARTLRNLLNLSKDNKLILKDFDPTNQEHLFMISVAYIARAISGVKIYVSANPFRLFFHNIKNRKHQDFIKLAKKEDITEKTKSFNEVLDFMRPYLEGVSYAGIYQRYYMKER